MSDELSGRPDTSQPLDLNRLILKTPDPLYLKTGLVLLLVFIFLTPAARAESPDVTLLGLDGKQHHLGEYVGRGKWVMLSIWGPRCPPCVEEMPELQKFHDAHHDKDAMVVGMALDYPSFGYAKSDEVKQFVEDHLISFPILLGDADIAGKFGAGPLQGTPTLLAFHPDGTLVALQVGQMSAQLIEQFINDYESKNPPK